MNRQKREYRRLHIHDTRASFQSIQLIVGLDLHVLPLAIWNAAFMQVLQLVFLFFRAI